MKKLIALALILLMTSFGCSSLPSTAPPVVAPSEPCSGEPVAIAGEEVVVGGYLLVFLAVDKNCDQKCDMVAVLLYLGTFEGEHQFQILDVLPCDEAPKVIAKLKDDNKTKKGVGI
jgi:hypothetical protein